MNSYRYEDVGFAELLRAVARVDGIERVRFTSPYPVDFSDDVIAAIAETPKVCKHVHLPLQSRVRRVLERMRRGYDHRDVPRARRTTLRARSPGIAHHRPTPDRLLAARPRTITAPRSRAWTSSRFDSAFMFAYSERDLTYAARKLPDDVAADVKKRRLAEIDRAAGADHARRSSRRRSASASASSIAAAVEARSADS